MDRPAARAALASRPETVEALARIVHEANRAYCVTIGDHAAVPYDEAPGWQTASLHAGVRGVLDGSFATVEAQHEAWLATKRAEGWVYGPVKDAAAKTHPCCVAYADLPAGQRLKDYLFRGIIEAMVDGLLAVRGG